MAELTFGEKLLIARKQLDLYQYEMAERLGVHANSITNYERGEGKPHAAVVRMFELMCEKHNIRFDEYEVPVQAKGEKMKIVLAEKVSPATLAVFAAEPGWEVLTHDQLSDGLPAALADADALVVRSAVQVDDALMEKAPKLRVIGRAGVGVDNIDADAATRRGIVVMNTPGANAVAVAELTIGLMIALARKLPAADTTMHAGKWEKKSLQGTELRGKTLGILGLGRVGLEVARRARAFGVEIVGSDPFVSAAVARENGIRLVTVDELFATADYLTLHVGLTPQTEGIVNAKSLATMKKGIRIVNCARGELVNEAALVEALKSGHVGGAALDVFTVEPPKDSPYAELDNVILTPHIAGSTAEAQEAVGIQIAREVREYLKLGVVQNAVNLPSLTHEEYIKLAPFIDVAGRLGAFLAQAGSGGIEAIQLYYGGWLTEAKT
ncbi:MAG: NAD(P)-dependent oxidoreductase, partial [Terracidiphilus sp.]